MRVFATCLIGLVGAWAHATAEPLVEGRVLLPSGGPGAGSQVRLFDLTDLRAAPVGTAADESGHFTLPLTALPRLALPERFELGRLVWVGRAAWGDRPQTEEAGRRPRSTGLTVSGSGLVPYVDPAFRVTAGMAPGEVVVGDPGQRPVGEGGLRRDPSAT